MSLGLVLSDLFLMVIMGLWVLKYGSHPSYHELMLPA